jgi:hypothetical protein
MVRMGRIELPLPKKMDFESTASTNSATLAFFQKSYTTNIQLLSDSFIFQVIDFSMNFS